MSSPRIPRLVVAGTHSGVGKTTVATGLMAALTARGRRVAGFKVGPDFIDPSYHALATGRPPRNLDAFLSGSELVAPLFRSGAAGADIAVVEGVMGLFDGASGRGELASTAQVAKLLDAPVLLVVDAGAMARSVAALVHGYTTFDPQVRVAGVAVNNVASDRHEQLVRDALAPLGVPVVGVVRRSGVASTPARHLGLVPAAERGEEAVQAVAGLGAAVTAALDLDSVEQIAAGAGPLTAAPWAPPALDLPPVRVAVAGGRAFSFLYTEHVELLTAVGAEVVAVDPLRDEALPEHSDALYLGGGFPEVHAAELGANGRLLAAVADFARRQKPVVAECGGLLYLCASLDGTPMSGVLPADASMRRRLTLGYREATAAGDSVLWRRGELVRAHEFHHSAVLPAAGDRPAWRFEDREEGFVTGAVHASYLHSHWSATPQVAARLVRAAAAARQAVPA